MSSVSRVQRVAILIAGVGVLGSLGAWASRVPESQPVPQRGELPPVPVQPEGAKPATRPAPGVGFGRGQSQAEFRNLEHAMKAMDRGLEDVIENIDKPEHQERLLEVVSQMERAALFSKNAKFEGAKGDKAKETQAEFRRHGIRNAIMMLELELQLVQGKVDDAKATIKKIEDYRDKSHEEFSVDEHEEQEAKPDENAPPTVQPRGPGGR